MRRQLQTALSRVERIADDVTSESTRVDPAQFVAILMEGRQRAARNRAENRPRPTAEECLARGRKLRAMFAAARDAR